MPELTARQQRSERLEVRITELVDAGRRLDGNVGTATSVMAGLREAIAEIAAAASTATTTAHQAGEGSRESAGTVARLAATMVEIDQIAVVAGEVKDLAGETAKATERIRRVVDAVRGDVEAAGTSLESVQQVISGVVAAQSTIAAAVEEQSASTAQAQEAMVGASSEASRMAADLQRIVDGV